MPKLCRYMPLYYTYSQEKTSKKTGKLRCPTRQNILWNNSKRSKINCPNPTIIWPTC
ncbi:MAG: hypothetical protein ACTSRZ_13885 [Promethearchaeota archaeon]